MKPPPGLCLPVLVAPVCPGSFLPCFVAQTSAGGFVGGMSRDRDGVSLCGLGGRLGLAARLVWGCSEHLEGPWVGRRQQAPCSSAPLVLGTCSSSSSAALGPEGPLSGVGWLHRPGGLSLPWETLISLAPCGHVLPQPLLASCGAWLPRKRVMESRVSLGIRGWGKVQLLGGGSP